ncbi:MAG: hypothetical protein ACRD0G_10370, partial [Acidimicrobiales bacterium]
PQAGAAMLDEAAWTARAAGDLRVWGDAVAELHRLELTLRSGGPAPSPDRALAWLKAAGDAEPDVRARVLAVLAEQAFHDGDLGEGEQLGRDAVQAARAAGDRRVEAEAAFAVGIVALARLDLDTAAAQFDVSARAARADGNLAVTVWGVCRLPLVHLLAGRLDHAASAVAQARPLAESIHSWSDLSVVEGVAANVAAIAGDIASANDHLARAERLILRSGYPFAAPLVHPLAAHLALEAGDLAGARRALDEWDGLGPGTRAAYDAWIAARSGARSDALRLPAPDRLALRNAFRVVLAAESALRAGDNRVADECRPGLEHLAAAGVHYVPGHPVAVLDLLDQLSERVD